jgi:hypothetical protein
MATPRFNRWIGNLYGLPGPLVMPGKFAAGSSVPIDAGELLELTGNTNTEWVPMDSDFAMSGNVAIAACNLKSGDLAGYYDIIVPRPGDVFEFAIASGQHALGTAVYWSDSETVATTGSNVLGDVVSFDHYPRTQRFGSEGNPGDEGTTIRSTTKVGITIKAAASYFAALQS